MKAGISIATLADFHEVNRIQSEAFATPWSLDLIRAAIVNSKYEVRVLRAPPTQVGGFYISHAVRGRCNLDNLAVDEPLRGNGLGRKLVRDWISRAMGRGLFTLSLQVNTANHGAKRLYETFDFKAVRLLPGYYPNGEDAYQMEMALEVDQQVANSR